MTFLLLAVLILILVVAVLISVLIAVLIAVLIIVLVTVIVLIIHDLLPSSLIFAGYRYSSIPTLSGLIPGFEEDAG